MSPVALLSLVLNGGLALLVRAVVRAGNPQLRIRAVADDPCAGRMVGS